MRKTATKLAGLMLAFLFGVISCSKEEEYTPAMTPGTEVAGRSIGKESREVIITATREEDSETDTRTSLVTDPANDEQILAVYWTPGDQINIFSAGEAALFTSILTEPARVSKFRGMVSFITGADDGSETDYVWGLYPYDDDAEYNEPEPGVSRTATITTTMRWEQTAREGTFDDNLAISIGRSESLSIAFKNTYSGVRFTLTRPDIVKVTLRGVENEPLAGRFTVGMDDRGNPDIKNLYNPSTEVTLTTENGSPFIPGKYYYIVTLPTFFPSGYTLTLETATGQVGVFTSNPNRTFALNSFSRVKELDSSARIQEWEAPGSKILYTTTDGKALALAGSGIATRSGNANEIEEIIAPEANDGIGVIRYSGTVTSVDPGTFENCTTLREVILPETVETIGDGAFRGCTALERIELLSETPPTAGQDVFEGVGEHVICVPSGSEESYLTAQGWSDQETQITVSQDEPGTIDLGLPSGLLWASCNLGADVPQAYGDYYAWGEIEPKTEDFHWGNYRFGTNLGLTKYTEADCKILLESLDDAAYVHLGKNWRMPSTSEIQELLDGCEWTLTSLGGVAGYQGISKNNGKSIFLPAAGEYHNSTLCEEGDVCSFWSSEFRYPSITSSNGDWYAYSLKMSSYYKGWGYTDRVPGLQVRPVKGDIQHVSSFSLNQSSVSVAKGGSCTVNASILPETATLKSAFWTSSDETVAQVYVLNGYILGKSAGTAVITATTQDGGMTAQVTVTVTEPTYSEPETIDLGLASGLQWGSFNLGASAPEERGVLFAWGDTEPNGAYDLDNCPYYDTSTKKYLKYVTDTYGGEIDNLLTLEPLDDAANVILGNGWRMPTKDEFNELVEGCEWTFTSRNGENVLEGVSKTNGNSIFFPAAGCMPDLSSLGQAYAYWTSSVAEYYWAYSWMFTNKVLSVSGRERLRGMSIRPVKPAA